ncbi:MAG TPA: ATP-binding cassette domain-containing protein, partial [Roseiflexaceae bacterium]|nr:ATP-binding cassette domain-containing protein [Roseiflexaceae bacterium]
MTPLMELRNVTKTYGGGLLNQHPTVALKDANLTIDADPPKITAVVGESGSGKTTMALLLMGFLSP